MNKTEHHDYTEQLLEACLLAGKIMLQSGAETSRVADTLERIIRNALGNPNSSETYTYVTVNGIDIAYCAVGITCGLMIAGIIFRFTVAPFIR